eukprot:gene2863-5698_t
MAPGKSEKIFVLEIEFRATQLEVQRTIILSAEEASPVDIHHGQSLIPLLVSFGYLSTNWNSKTPPSN